MLDDSLKNYHYSQNLKQLSLNHNLTMTDLSSQSTNYEHFTLKQFFPEVYFKVLLINSVKNSDNLFELLNKYNSFPFEGSNESLSGKKFHHDGNLRPSFVLLNAKHIASLSHVMIATFRAVYNYKNEILKTKNLASEVIYYLSPNNNLNECFQKFGLNEILSSVILLGINVHDEYMMKFQSEIDGVAESFEKLATITDNDFIIKHMGITNPELKLHGGLDAAILNKIALKGILR